MKFFKSLLVAPAALVLLAPMSAMASEINFADVSAYSSSKQVKRFSDFSISKELVTKNESADALEPQINNFEAGSFSETTTMSGSASFQVGAVNGSNITEALTATYSYDLDLNTSFTGEDNLYVGIETGNDSANVDFSLDSSGGGADILSVTSMYYRFPLGEYDIAVGPILDSDDLMPTTTSKYSDSFYFGSEYSLDSNFFAKQGTGAGFAVARTFDNGINASGSIIGTGASTASGILTEEGNDILTLSLGYDADNYGGGIIYQRSDSLCVVVDNFADLCNEFGINALIDWGYSATTLGAYYSPGEKTTLSVTSTFIDASVQGASIDTVNDYQFAVDRELGNGTLSASWKTFPFYRIPDLNGSEVNSDELGSYTEIYYTYNVNDSFSITPGIAFAMPSQDADDITASGDDLGFFLFERTVIGVGATFKF